MTSITVERFKNEELINVLTHFPGVFLGLLATLMIAIKTADLPIIASMAYLIFGITFIMLYGSSTIYHYHHVKDSDRKQFYKKVDHAAIYIFIAGCYTPFVYTYMVDEFKEIFLTIVWIIASLGVIYKFMSKYRTRGISLGLYLGFGFMSLLTKQQMLDHMPQTTFLLLALGGACYVVGSLFYMMTKIPYHHGIWHLFSLAGSVCHLVAVFMIF